MQYFQTFDSIMAEMKTQRRTELLRILPHPSDIWPKRTFQHLTSSTVRNNICYTKVWWALMWIVYLTSFNIAALRMHTATEITILVTVWTVRSTIPGANGTEVTNLAIIYLSNMNQCWFTDRQPIYSSISHGHHRRNVLDIICSRA